MTFIDLIKYELNQTWNIFAAKEKNDWLPGRRPDLEWMMKNVLCSKLLPRNSRATLGRLVLLENACLEKKEGLSGWNRCNQSANRNQRPLKRDVYLPLSLIGQTRHGAREFQQHRGGGVNNHFMGEVQEFIKLSERFAAMRSLHPLSVGHPPIFLTPCEKWCKKKVRSLRGVGVGHPGDWARGGRVK